MPRSSKQRRDTKIAGSTTSMDSSLREQMEASLRNQMDVSIGHQQAMDSSDPSHFIEGSSRRSAGSLGAAAPINASGSSDNNNNNNNNNNNSNNNGAQMTREALLEQIVNPYIEDDSPAAEALRANAQIHIGRMSKVARSINAQALRKVVKRASMRGQFGKVKGKPPRVPPPSQQIIDEADGVNQVMSEIEEGELEDDSTADPGVDNDSNRERHYSPTRTTSPDSIEPQLSAETHKTEERSSSVGKQSPAAASGNGDQHFKPNGDALTTPSSSIKKQRYSEDHLQHSLQAMKKHDVDALAPEENQKDIPQEVVEGTMEAGRKGMSFCL